MKLLHTIAEVRHLHDEARRDGKRVGLVPTMGYLHDGHASLMRAAAQDNDLVTATIFVNPLQFGPSEDLASYPRDLEADMVLAEAAGVDVIFAPEAAEMYPERRVLTTVGVSALAQRWEGASRPGHFEGVATVVAKLFAIAGECRAYFGEKDYQQLQVVKRMAFDLSLPVEVIGCPIIREPDGLAMSSRNVYLDTAERRAATVLKRSIDQAGEAALAGETSARRLEELVRQIIVSEPLARLDYVAVVDTATLEPLERVVGEARLLLTAKVGKPRLLDNAALRVR